jgi:nudix-type nucleoside diphosphatase (YffH/AdpP family)
LASPRGNAVEGAQHDRDSEAQREALGEFDKSVERRRGRNEARWRDCAPCRLGLCLTRTNYTDRPEDPMKPEILERQIAHAGYITVERLRMRLTDGAEVSREVERHGDAAAVLPYDVERRSALVVRLFRAPVLVASGEEMSEEACAGMIENEDADTTARREAYEELGVDLPSLEFVARVWSSPGVSTERQSLFLAPYRSADRISDGGGVEGEREGITVVERLLAELAADVDQGRIADGKLLTLVLALRLRRPDLFV